MSLETPTWPKITGALGTTTTEFGASDWANLISDYYNGVNLGLVDASKIPIIGTLTRYKHEKLGLFDIDQSHYIIFSADDIDTGANRKIKFRRMNSPFEEDHAVLEGMPQALLNKDIDFDLNTGSNIGTTAIKDNAITQAKMADNSIGTAEIIDGSVNSAKITDDSIMNIDINSAAGITDGKLAQITDKSKLHSQIAYKDETNWLTSAMIPSGTVTNDDLAGSISNDKLLQITDATKIQDSLITSAKIADGTIMNVDINTSAGITDGKLAQITDKTKLPTSTLYTTDSQIIENKQFDMRKNLVNRLSRTGWYSCVSSGIDAGGSLSDMVGFGNLVMTQTVAGKYHRWTTNTGIANDSAGVCALATWIAIRWFNPLLRVRIRSKPNTNSNRQQFIGWSAQKIVANSDTEPLASNESGFMFGHGAADTQYQIFRNDATGPCQKTTTGINIPPSDTDYILEIEADNALIQFKWTLWSVIGSGSGNVGSKDTQLGTGTFNTRIPGQSTGLYFQNTLFNTLTTPAEDNNILGVEVFVL